ncbi:hypothetical protein [Spirosoma montaniterrae]|uniref:Uncharacterized protein n=1 Tax=Spirosoma montaniterrae TaxID=1178516 RepID=A0A1P9WSD9_9BACT|nr:hypothetical protein [Spirosoma montaniterrae]AQG78305.1 hypothetical protein AWR27_02480 [Spirosoma montaniterrae]
MKQTFLVALAFSLSTLFFQCGSDRKRERTADKPAASTVEKAPTLGELHFFLETSASMGGYLKGATEFKNIVADFVTKANQIKPLSLHTISAGKPQPLNSDINQFVAQLATTPLATGKSSELHQIFRQVGETAAGNNVAIFVSDCILSFPDADIRRDPEVNRNNAASTLKNNMYDQFARFNKQGIGATVYAYTSAFNGTYYTYQNQKQKLVGEQRPFYIWVIGKQALLADVNRQLSDLLSTQPTKRLDFGAVNPLKTYDLFFSLNKKGDWRAVRGNVAEIKTGRKADPVEFAVGLTLDKLPAYAQAENYIRQNLKTSATNGGVKLVNVQRRNAVKTDRLSDREQKLLSQHSHVLTFRVEQLFDNEADVTLSLPARTDMWYADWSTSDDRTPAGRRNKTFAFNELMTGVREAYQSGNNEYINLKFKLIKD